MSAHHVELRNVTKRFGAQKAVNQVDLVLKAGESVGLAGHNGAGKSTLIKLILGLITPTEGEVMLLGERTGSKAGAQLRSQIGYLPETVALHPSLSGIETLNFYAKLKKQPLTKNHELLERVGISQAARRRVGTYSKGMRQRLALAQALLGEPKVLLFDEPTTGLDPASRQMFYEVVRELNGRGATVLLSTHALAELDGHADRIVVMKNGVKVADGSMDELHVQSGLPPPVNQDPRQRGEDLHGDQRVTDGVDEYAAALSGPVHRPGLHRVTALVPCPAAGGAVPAGLSGVRGQSQGGAG